jgi:diadenosine tetraphosphatase ApaH/serine/threonine PP2A family protein phosphatase
MRTLIISDVHANLTALNAVVQDAGTFERVWCLGDLVGYGPDPNECIERVAALPGLNCIKGNHDAAILGEIDIKAFNDEARASLTWLASELNEKNKRWLAKLDARMDLDEVTLAHGSPRKPIWEYIMEQHIASVNMDAFETLVCLVGHTHIPGIFQLEANHPQVVQQYGMVAGKTFTLDQKSIINPGSIGQPRDHDPRAAYMLHDSAENQWIFRRVAYDIQQVQERILAAGLPRRHAARLESGW